ncbi:DUF6046 domain-containing protein [Hymenobacter rubripertinctus]|uniref:DUF6046 domain-containing protein n=1 Tax=Hymenobacter rubripertinctus TaxID=2029981 RepID=A0A418QMY4_9BACT|nr:DUF6046 domain-containing protein [Hymenobacter rubripertinctus]RIY06458.1 hypothetical protein D0T11_18635 [Hymenobacter rubripertinctus]
MAEVTFQIDNLYRQAFPNLASKPLAKLEGVRDLAIDRLDRALGNGYQPSLAEQAPAALDFGGVQALALKQGSEMSYLGTPIFQPMFFVEGTYQMLGTGSRQGQVVEAPFDRWRLPASATAEFNRPKEISKSKPNAAFGTTKEMWAFGDWDVTIRGFLLHPDVNTYPEEELLRLLRWEQVADSIGVDGEMFNFLGISRLVIERINLGRINGMPNLVPFQLQCSSDEALEISLQNNRPQ